MWQAEAFEEALKAFLGGTLLTRPAVLRDAIHYSVFSGGKRTRPRIVFAVGETLELPPQISTALAIALELIHTYTLIHDDLPAMDNDDVRRGKATLHKQFDEATALLSGDALIGLGIDAVFSIPREIATAEQILTAAQILNAVAGARGVIAGQILETERLGTLEDWTHVAQLKTGSLFQAAFLLPACFAGDDPATLGQLARDIGVAFQIVDDLEDPESDAIEDAKNIVHIEGRAAARTRALVLLDEASQLAGVLPHSTALLEVIEDLKQKANA